MGDHQQQPPLGSPADQMGAGSLPHIMINVFPIFCFIWSQYNDSNLRPPLVNLPVDGN